MGTGAVEQRNPKPHSEDITEADLRAFESLISTELTPEQADRILTPPMTCPRQSHVLAVHWHPEFVPMDLIRRRIGAMFPNRVDEMIIPTQHNVLTTYDRYAGVEVDCFSRSFNRKVQLLIHFEASRVEDDRADVFRAMLAHTFNYRSRQLFEFIDTIVDEQYDSRIQQAAAAAGADDDLIQFVRAQTRKIEQLINRHEDRVPREMIRNKLLAYFFDSLRVTCGDRYIDRAVLFLRAIKKVVKSHFSNDHFYTTEEIIEEVRGLGGGIVIPHPEQFWPILLADYDVDGYEVWNPQSREYTEFLIQVVNQHNASHPDRRRILIFMGDDCHMGEKVKNPRYQDPEKTGREIGVQPPWDDLTIRKSLIVASANRSCVIRDYRERLES